MTVRREDRAMKRVKKEKQRKNKKMEAERIYKERSDRHFDELRWLYMELYDNSSMFAELCDQITRNRQRP